jgi:hypothetical protein
MHIHLESLTIGMLIGTVAAQQFTIYWLHRRIGLMGQWLIAHSNLMEVMMVNQLTTWRMVAWGR